MYSQTSDHIYPIFQTLNATSNTSYFHTILTICLNIITRWRPISKSVRPTLIQVYTPARQSVRLICIQHCDPAYLCHPSRQHKNIRCSFALACLFGTLCPCFRWYLLCMYTTGRMFSCDFIVTGNKYSEVISRMRSSPEQVHIERTHTHVNTQERERAQIDL